MSIPTTRRPPSRFLHGQSVSLSRYAATGRRIRAPRTGRALARSLESVAAPPAVVMPAIGVIAVAPAVSMRVPPVGPSPIVTLIMIAIGWRLCCGQCLGEPIDLRIGQTQRLLFLGQYGCDLLGA